jgi:hypothetical protein
VEPVEGFSQFRLVGEVDLMGLGGRSATTRSRFWDSRSYSQRTWSPLRPPLWWAAISRWNGSTIATPKSFALVPK